MTDVKLPPLPDKKIIGTSRFGAIFYAYTDESLYDYARLAVLQERERCAKVCQSLANTDWVTLEAAYECADAIRKGE